MSAAVGAYAAVPSSDRANALRIGLALLGVAGVTALAVRFAGAADARDWLGFSFPGIPREFGEVIAILASNLRILAALLVACFVAQLGQSLAVRDDSPTGRVGAGLSMAFVFLCDLAIAGAAVVHALIIGGGVGAYGAPMLSALLPHGPLELAVYSLALALYVAARRGPVSLRRGLTVAAACAIGLLVTAPIEVFLAL